MKLIREVKENNIVTRSGLLLDRHSKIDCVRVVVAPHQSLHYFLIQTYRKPATHRIEIKLKKKSSLCFSGAMLRTGAGNAACHIAISHEGPETRSSVVLHGIVAGTASLTIHGTVTIQTNASRSSAMLEERVLLLSHKASAHVVPALTILTHTIKARHAATISHVPEDELFYLATRGITRPHAVRLLASSFLCSQLTLLSEETVRAMLVQELSRNIARCLQ